MGIAERYTLRQVADLTGLSEFTLRGWEGRYQAFEPQRTETGRRQYSKDDLKRAFLLRELIQRGKRISDVAQLSTATLEKTLATFDAATLTTDKEHFGNLDVVLKCAFLQDWDQLKKQVCLAIKNKNSLHAIETVILPLLSNVGLAIATGRLGIAQEHIVSALIKEQLYGLLLKSPLAPKEQNPMSVVVATPEGDYHELGILIAHVIFNYFGVNSLFLGCNTPKNSLCETALKYGATHILLASTVSRKNGALEDVFSYVHYLDQNLPQSLNIWMGGPNFEKLNMGLNRPFKIFNSLQELPQTLKQNSQKNRGSK